MTLSIGELTVDCNDVAIVSAFWSATLGIPVDAGASPYMATLNRDSAELPRMLFLRVPEAKTAKNRFHLDLVADGSTPRADEVARLVALGATQVADKDEWGHSWAVLTDPEGNEFCVAEMPDSG